MTHTVVSDLQGNRFELRPLACPTCGPSDVRTIGLRGGRFHRYGWGVTTTIVQCRTCGLLFPDPFPYPVDASRLYGDPAKYFSRHDEQKKLARYRRLIRDVVRLTGKKDPSVLDVGSGRGELVQAGRLEGLSDIVGLEFSDAMIAHAREHYDVTLVPQTIEEFAATRSEPFDAIVLNAVIEHVVNPDSMIDACAKLTRPGAWLFIDTPNEPNLLTVIGNAVNRIRRSPAVYNLSPTWTPYHVFGFNPRALGVLLKKHGFQVVRIRIKTVPEIPSRRELKDRLRAWVGTQLGRLSNWTRTANNMGVLARRTE